jgi:hypothetical protein
MQELDVVKLRVKFLRPSIGADHYIAFSVGSWPESFRKDESDKALKDFIGEVPLEDQLKNFALKMLTEHNKIVTWDHVLTYLNNLFNRKPIPLSVGVAFWAKARPFLKEVGCDFSV